MSTEWILMVDATRARLLQRAGDLPTLLLQEFQPQSEAAAGSPPHWGSDDLQGRARRQAGLADVLGSYLETAACEGRFDSLAVVAGSAMLPTLQAALGRRTRALPLRVFSVDVPLDDEHETALRAMFDRARMH